LAAPATILMPGQVFGALPMPCELAEPEPRNYHNISALVGSLRAKRAQVATGKNVSGPVYQASTDIA